MRTISTTLFALVVCAGVASAGDDTTKTAAPKKEEKKPAVDAKAAVKADVKVDPKTGAKPAAPPEGAMPEKPTLPTALVDLTKAQKGTWTCAGSMMGPDGNEAYKNKMTIKVKADLDGQWLRADLTESKNKATKYPFKMSMFTTYSEKDSKWLKLSIDNWGGTMKGWSTGPDASGKVTWEMDASGPMGESKFRDYEEPVAGKKNQIHMWGEMSADKGKTWIKVYDATCKK